MLIEPPFCNNLLIRGEGLPPPPVGSAKRRVRADPGRWPVQRRRDLKLPDDKILVAGVLDTSTNYVEHPELVAERLCRFADIVGRERVMAGSDCGFSTFRVRQARSRHLVQEVARDGRRRGNRLSGCGAEPNRRPLLPLPVEVRRV
jgi:hypothetical protein